MTTNPQQVECPECGLSGLHECPSTGKVPDPAPIEAQEAKEGEKVECPDCNGTGIVAYMAPDESEECERCLGRGYVRKAGISLRDAPHPEATQEAPDDELEKCYIDLWYAIDDAATARKLERKFKTAITQTAARMAVEAREELGTQILTHDNDCGIHDKAKEPDNFCTCGATFLSVQRKRIERLSLQRQPTKARRRRG